MNIPYIMKRCTCCGRWLVASVVNFHRQKTGKYGLKGECKECASKRNKQYREANKDKIAETNKRWCEANKEKVAEYKKQYYKDNKDKAAEYNKQYREVNRDKIFEQRKQYRENNKDKIAERRKQYYQDNKDKVVKRHKRYNQSLQGQVSAFNRHNRRRTKEEQQGTGITKDQWLEMMKFFDFRCAYSDEYIGGDSFNRTIDHIVPLNSGGDNMIWNCVPMTRSLNSSKHAKDMVEWYKEQSFYSETRLAKIYEWQEYARKKWYKGEK